MSGEDGFAASVPAPFWRFARYAYVAVLIGCALIALYGELTSPSTPDPATGHIYLLKSRTLHAYVTPFEYIAGYVALGLGAGWCLMRAALRIRRRS